MINKMNIAIRKEIRKQVKLAGNKVEANMPYVQHALKIQFPSANWEDWKGYALEQVESKFENN